MSWKIGLLVAHAALTQVVLAYEYTRYFVNSTYARGTYTYGDSTSTRLQYSTFEVRLTDSATPSHLSATTSSGTLVTMVTAWVHQDIGSQLPITWNDERPELYVTVTFDTCYSYGDNEEITWFDTPVTQTASLYLETALSDFLAPTTTIGTMAFLNPTDLHPIHLARASYAIVPTQETLATCRRETSTVDYRSLCSTWYMTGKESTTTQGTRTVTVTAEPTPQKSSCGELNPCCYGCHPWGYGFPFPEEASYLVCEDGFERELNGTAKNNSRLWEYTRGENAAPRDQGTVFWGLGLSFFLAMLAAL